MKKNTLKKCAALVTTVALSFSILAGCDASPKQVEAKKQSKTNLNSRANADRSRKVCEKAKKM